jgi:hypothetical protein
MRRKTERPIRHTGAVVLAAALLWSAPALAQSASGPLDFLGNIFGGKSKADQTGSAPSAQPASTGGPTGWSGEDGASGHPLMTAGAIR